jgi:hypothetical protein
MPKSYVFNVAKEVKQFGGAWLKTWQASGEVGPGTDARANMLKRKEDKAKGQLLGAVLQGRRYDDKTGKQIKKRMPTPVMPKTGPATRIAKKAAAKKK